MNKKSGALRLFFGAGLITGGVLMAASQLLAHDGHMGATGIIKERMDTMKSFGKAVGTMADMLKGKLPYDAAFVRDGAQTINTHAGERLLSYFPEGSLDKNSDALPAIWQDWSRFSELAADLKTHSATLEEAAESQAAFMPAFIDLTDTCSACHTKFRVEQKEE